MFYIYCWYFFIFAFVGWCVEVAFATIKQGKFVNRGFLNGPVCPIYGCGVAIVAILLLPLKDNIPLLFVGSLIVTSGIEFFTGLILEKLFHTKWWDYSTRKFNLMGYICLEFSLIWGVACTLVVRFLLPFIDILIGFIPQVLGIVLLSVMAALILSDTITTVTAIIGLNKQLRTLTTISEKLHENSEKIGKKVSDQTLEFKDKYDKLSERMTVETTELKEKYEKLNERITAETAELKEKYDSIMNKQSLIRKRIMNAFPNMRHTVYQEKFSELRSLMEEKGILKSNKK